MTDDNVKPLFGNQPQPVVEESNIQPGYLQAVEAALDIGAARILGLLAVLGGIAIWGWAAYDPHMIRLYAGAGYSLGVLGPTMWLYVRKG